MVKDHLSAYLCPPLAELNGELAQEAGNAR